MMVNVCNLENNIHVWYHYIEDYFNASYEAAMLKLPERELSELMMYKKQEDKIRRLCGRILLQKALDATTNACISIRQLTKNAYGKPFLPHWYHFSIAHAGRMVVLVFSQKPIGVDIECHNDNIIKYETLLEIMHPQEQEKIKNSHSPEVAFLGCWTKKEALLKAHGTGINDTLSSINTECGESITYVGKKWRWVELNLQQNYCSHIAIPYTKPLNIFKKLILFQK
ncbi:MAG: 4'-phosphopantetheinyl transferase superfamily protein [Cytophagaceae bacterium]|nr:4'-phosphopantetheinyl transferase superfamily protein [Cytophagaceae bacterium]MDW8455440.1 4'-phosphopantetheinyl transferase superfamily protein [Cytophagaceae bacterium]